MESGPPSARLEQDFYVGDWFVRPQLNLIVGRGATTQVEPKIMQVLVCLATQPGEPLTRAALHERVWPDTIVGEKALTRAVSELRKVFEDDPRDPHIIETISKTGYRLIAPVSYAGDATPGASIALDVSPTFAPAAARRLRFRIGYLIGGVLLGVILGAGGVWMLLSRLPVSPTPAIPLTTFQGHELSPTLSPDGREVAFAWQGVAGDNWDIYVMKPGGEASLRLTHHEAEDVGPVWSPEGTHVAFRRFDDEARTCVILLVPALSGPERKLASCDWFTMPNRAYYVSRFAWSPDGAWLAFADRTTRGDPLRITLLSLETQQQRPITTPPDGYLGDTNPVFSPDGTRLSFRRMRSGNSADLYVIPVADGRERRLTTDYRGILGHTWTPDGKRIVFSSNRGGTYDLWAIPVSGGTPVWVPASGGNLKAPSFARQRWRMAYENWLYDTNIWRVALDAAPNAAAATSFIASTLWDVDPRYSPDGRRVAFVSTRSGSYELWTSDAEGANPVRLTHFEGPTVGAPRWSADGQHLVFEARPEGAADLYVIDAQGGASRRFTQEAADEMLGSWSHDGRWIYYSSNQSGAWQIWKKTVEGDSTVQVTQHGGFAPFESADGQFMYYTKNGAAGLWRMPTAGGGESLILDTLMPGDWGNWVLTKQGIYFITRDPTRARTVLSFFDVDTETIREVIPLVQAPPMHQAGLTLSPDGRWMLYPQIDRTESDLMFVEDAR